MHTRIEAISVLISISLDAVDITHMLVGFLLSDIVDFSHQFYLWIPLLNAF
jgi:hypothetical protein